MKKQESGFTLIELVVVIIILGILAAVALPKFMGLSEDARVSVVNGMSGSVLEAADMVHALAEVQGQAGATGSVALPDGSTVTTAYAYPDGSATGILLSLQGESATATSSFPFLFTAGTAPAASTFAYAAAGSATPFATVSATTGCEVDYVPSSAAGVAPTSTPVTAGC
ncbi:MAG TPA: type II secretion system protein [Acidiferrobacter sp.]|nr:type II secretion system protein [Acidiferrobacter sp.]